MNKGKKNILKNITAFCIAAALALPMGAPVSAQAAELCLAYQKDENGRQIVELSEADREQYKVAELFLKEEDAVDLCFLNASLWSNPQWKSENPEVAQVDNAGVIKAVAPGTTKIMFSYTNILTKDVVSTSVQVFVGEEWITEGQTAAEDIMAETVIVENITVENSIEENNTIAETITEENVAAEQNVQNPEEENVKQVWTVQEKLDYFLEEQLGAKDGNYGFCTVNRSACGKSTGHSGGRCSNCETVKFVKADWFIETFGKINADNFPDHDYISSGKVKRVNKGYSCLGFACFAQWYLYADSADEKLVGERVAKVSFNKENMLKYAQPGDVLRANGHSFLVYELKEDSMVVVDCNWGSDMPDCVVQKHEFAYTYYYYAGKTTYINRVTKVENMPENTAGSYFGTADVNQVEAVEKTAEEPEIETQETPEEKAEEMPEASDGNKTSEAETTVAEQGTEALDKGEKRYGTLDITKKGGTQYNVGLTVEMWADKAYPIKQGAKLELLGLYTNSSGAEIYHVYSPDLDMECYVRAKYVVVEE